jgi:hypothetical protein
VKTLLLALSLVFLLLLTNNAFADTRVIVRAPVVSFVPAQRTYPSPVHSRRILLQNYTRPIYFRSAQPLRYQHSRRPCPVRAGVRIW